MLETDNVLMLKKTRNKFIVLTFFVVLNFFEICKLIWVPLRFPLMAWQGLLYVEHMVRLNMTFKTHHDTYVSYLFSQGPWFKCRVHVRSAVLSFVP